MVVEPTHFFPTSKRALFTHMCDDFAASQTRENIMEMSNFNVWPLGHATSENSNFIQPNEENALNGTFEI